ncbi:MAG: inositol monophosphatase family protein [Actinomycetota bacterium]|jgi:myo-inositol-1(or 4)-monophosphatase|nr:inositol monophosphatase family protein [Actinomycetota bacterium]
MKSYQTFLEAAKTFAADAAGLASSSRKRHFSVSSKSSVNDMVTNVDKDTENYIVERISREFPDDTIIAEESGHRTGTSGISWVIDPIDGTTNFIYDFPSCTVSIGVRDNDTTVAGAVCDVMQGDIYWAGVGIGSFKNSDPIHVRDGALIENSLIGTGFGYSSARRIAQAEFLASIIGDIRDIRRTGAASLDLCYVAEGRLDGYYEVGLWPWDFTAAALIVTEAGGYVLGPKDTTPSGELTVAASTMELASFLRAKVVPHLPFADA